MDMKFAAMGIVVLVLAGFIAYNQLSVTNEQVYRIEAPFNLKEEAKLASSDAPKDVELTIYQVEPNYYAYIGANGFDINNGMALIKEKRSVNLPSGLAKIQMKGTAQYLDSTSLHLKDLTDITTNVLEQNYQYDLVDSTKLMEKYLDKEIEVVLGNSQGNSAKESVKGKLLSFSNGLVLQTSTGVVTLNSYEKINYPVLPEGLITSPTIEWLLQNSKEGQHDFQVSYLASGLNWNADYVAIANKDDSLLDITGWVSIKNTAGATFKDAKLKLVAGDINIVRQSARGGYYEKSYADVAMGAPAQPQFQEESLFEYHLYTLQRPATLMSNENKQITLFDAKNTPVEKQFVYEGDGTKVKTKLIFENKKENNLGIPMPKGKVRVYKADSEGQLQFLGEDQIDHTPEKEKVRLFLGNAFDIVAEKKQVDRKEIGTCASQYSYSVELRNHKKEKADVTVLQDAYGEASIISENMPSVKESSTQFSWKVPVPADGSATLTYTIQQRYC
ncbi:MAG TPA: DUF4139 domain-containing protein [Candidatus Norongarragalinales archaeon]|nr:DUF4139 domain-containing protein [Candidatus Norongarragalinales archaeon]